MLKSFLKTFFKSEISIGVSLFFSAIFALLIANSQNYQIYQNFFAINAPLNLGFIGFGKNLTIKDWINDFLMALFFLLVGLELKKEILVGELSSKKKLALPAIAALGGIIFPALIFIFCNSNSQENLRAFAVPTATDIAFAYGAISLFGKKISNSLKVFLVALAVLDDLVGILLIAIFYSQKIELNYLLIAILPLVILYFLNYKNCCKIWLYLFLGIFLWLLVLKSGIHPSLSGVALALFIPLEIGKKSPLASLAHRISPTVNFLILPLFAFANAGVKIENFSLKTFAQPMTLGIILGLFFGKQFGVMLFSFLAIKFKIVHLPRGANWLEFWGAAIFTGIGFTMSLFIGALAFAENSVALNQVKIGVLAGSLLSIIFGNLVIKFSQIQLKPNLG